MKNPKTGSARLTPDTRPETIETYIETNGDQTATYKFFNAHPIISGILDKLAFFRTHAAAVYYNRLANKTVKQKFDDVDAAVGELNEKLIPFDFYVPSGSDINDPEFSKFGFYSGANLVNAPTASWFQWFTFPLNGNPNYPAQLGFTIERGNTRIFTRGTLIEGSSKVWADWVEYITKTYADNMFKIIEKSSESFSVPQNSNFGTEIVVPIPSGYKYVCIIDVWSASMNIVSTNRWLDSGTGEEVKIKVNGRNVSDQGVDVFRVHASILAQKI